MPPVTRIIPDDPGQAKQQQQAIAANQASYGISPSTKPGDAAAAVAVKQVGKMYGWGSSGPDTFDCSGLMVFAYSQGANITIPHNVAAIWDDQNVTTVVYDGLQGAQGPQGIQYAPGSVDTSKLEVGDMFLYYRPGADPNQQHVKMYTGGIGGGQMVEAPSQGKPVRMDADIDTTGDAAEPLRGIKRVTGGGSSGSAKVGGGGGGANSGKGTGQQNGPTIGATNAPDSDQARQNLLADLTDPRNNLPFSAYFQSQILTGSNLGYLPKGATARVNPTVLPGSPLVRGGMVELKVLKTADAQVNDPNSYVSRKGGKPFAVYFMMNPETIDVSCSIQTDATAPTQTDPTAMTSGSFWMALQTVTFTLIFNRMYEVWQGNIPGPSDIGCRWDIRAIERLVGMYDATAEWSKGSSIRGDMGLGNYGAGQNPPVALPVQVVFGGPNSYRFQGQIGSIEYEYTRFDANMIPIEASCDISIMKYYLPQLSGQDLMQPFIDATGQTGTVFMPQSTGGFNATTGLGRTGNSGYGSPVQRTQYGGI